MAASRRERNHSRGHAFIAVLAVWPHRFAPADRRTKKSPREAGFDTSFAAWTAGRADSCYFIV